MKKSTIIVLALIVVLAIVLGILVKLNISQNTNLQMPNQEMQKHNEALGNDKMGGASTPEYSAVNEVNEDTDIKEGEYSSENSDENALLISGDIDVNIQDITVYKTGDSDGGDSTSFYGTNSGIIAKDGANTTIDGITVTTDATGANGVFCYGGSATTNNSSSDGTTVTISY